MKKLKFVVLLIALFVLEVQMFAQQVIRLSPDMEDVTSALRHQLENVAQTSAIKIVFEPGEYRCLPDYAHQEYCVITNHGNGLKSIFCLLENYEKVEIEGNGSKLLFHGQIFPFLFRNCQSAQVRNLVIDWDIPFTFLGEVVAVDSVAGWREVKPFKDGFSWKVKRNQIVFPDIDGFSYTCLGSSLEFDKEKRKVADHAFDFYSNPTKVEKRPNGVLRIYERLKKYPSVGSLLSSKGDRENDRYAPAFDFNECKNIIIDKVTIHHALGMGFLFERSENIHLMNSKIVLSPDTHRVVSTTADASHYANCKGDILVENCLFENMLDDGVNVHGTYVEVKKIIDNHTLRVALKHFEQRGFKFAEPGDEVWFIKKPSPERQFVNCVKDVRQLNETYTDLIFEQPLPEGIAQGDLVENKTWNPTFTLRESTIQNHRARNIVLKTPLKIVIENNHFSSMMASVLLRGESHFWFESGAVGDVLVRNNYFKDCTNCGDEQAVFFLSPRLGKAFDKTAPYDRHVRFENNVIEGAHRRVLWAHCVDGLVFKGNQIRATGEGVNSIPAKPVIDLNHCCDVEISHNEFQGEFLKCDLKVDDTTKQSLKVCRNKNMKH